MPKVNVQWPGRPPFWAARVATARVPEAQPLQSHHPTRSCPRASAPHRLERLFSDYFRPGSPVSGAFREARRAGPSVRQTGRPRPVTCRAGCSARPFRAPSLHSVHSSPRYTPRCSICSGTPPPPPSVKPHDRPSLPPGRALSLGPGEPQAPYIPTSGSYPPGVTSYSPTRRFTQWRLRCSLCWPASCWRSLLFGPSGTQGE